MNHKQIVVKLIVEAMRFRQYAAVLQKLGVDTSHFETDLMDVTGRLLDIDMTDEWMELYVREINKCTYLCIEPMGENLVPLAEVCYYTLLSLKNHDDMAVFT